MRVFTVIKLLKITLPLFIGGVFCTGVRADFIASKLITQIDAGKYCGRVPRMLLGKDRTPTFEEVYELFPNLRPKECDPEGWYQDWHKWYEEVRDKIVLDPGKMAHDAVFSEAANEQVKRDQCIGDVLTQLAEPEKKNANGDVTHKNQALRHWLNDQIHNYIKLKHLQAIRNECNSKFWSKLEFNSQSDLGVKGAWEKKYESVKYNRGRWPDFFYSETEKNQLKRVCLNEKVFKANIAYREQFDPGPLVNSKVVTAMEQALGVSGYEGLYQQYETIIRNRVHPTRVPKDENGQPIAFSNETFLNEVVNLCQNSFWQRTPISSTRRFGTIKSAWEDSYEKQEDWETVNRRPAWTRNFKDGFAEKERWKKMCTHPDSIAGLKKAEEIFFIGSPYVNGPEVLQVFEENSDLFVDRNRGTEMRNSDWKDIDLSKMWSNLQLNDPNELIETMQEKLRKMRKEHNEVNLAGAKGSAVIPENLSGEQRQRMYDEGTIRYIMTEKGMLPDMFSVGDSEAVKPTAVCIMAKYESSAKGELIEMLATAGAGGAFGIIKGGVFAKNLSMAQRFTRLKSAGTMALLGGFTPTMIQAAYETCFGNKVNFNRSETQDSRGSYLPKDIQFKAYPIREIIEAAPSCITNEDKKLSDFNNDGEKKDAKGYQFKKDRVRYREKLGVVSAESVQLASCIAEVAGTAMPLVSGLAVFGATEILNSCFKGTSGETFCVFE